MNNFRKFINGAAIYFPSDDLKLSLNSDKSSLKNSASIKIGTFIGF